MAEASRRATQVAAKKLGDILLERNLITQGQVDLALSIAREQGKKLGQVLVEQGVISPLMLATALSYQLNVPIVDLKKYQVSQEAVKLLPEDFARSHRVLPLAIESGTLLVATAEPQSLMVLEDLRARVRMRVKPLLALEGEIEEAINRYYRATVEIEKQISQVAPTAPPGAPDRVSQELITSSPVVRAVDLIVSQAVKDRASDIHLEPQRDSVKIRFRLDGMLHDAMSLPLGVHASMISRLKVMAGMNIAERRRPQDGQFTVRVGQSEIDVRAATIETDNGEMMVLRILDKSLSVLQLSELGLQPGPQETFEKMLRAPFGAILCAGPTGAGKTTTLYGALNCLNKDKYNIITIEDPIEYRFSGVNQIQVNRQADITFANGLRAILRLDPDVILVGEVRDRETAEIAIHAALTGHLVLSSIHANDATGALFRLMDLGVEPLLLTSGLIGSVSQRLVRKVCPHCRAPYEPPLEEIMAYKEQMGEERTEFYHGTGCNLCANTGYLGRTAVFEVFTLSEEFRARLLRGMSHAEARAQAIRDGMLPMQRDGMLKARDGITTLYEVIRNVFVL